MEYIVQNTRSALLGRKVIPSRQGTDVSLEKGELFRLEDGLRGRSILVLEGRVWFTQSGNQADIILEKGQTHQIACTGTTLVQGLPAARIRFV